MFGMIHCRGLIVRLHLLFLFQQLSNAASRKMPTPAPAVDTPAPISSAPKAVSSSSLLSYVPLSSFSWDQDNDQVKVRVR